jgi:putative copper export protein
LIDWIHILSAAGWGGSVIAFGVCTFRIYSTLLEKPLVFVALMFRLSLVSAISFGCILLSGIYNASWLIGSFAALWSTPTGHVLLAKLCFVSVMIVMGAVNLLLLLPRIYHWAKTNQPTRAIYLIKTTLSFDIVTVIIVLTIAAILINSIPVMNM